MCPWGFQQSSPMRWHPPGTHHSETAGIQAVASSTLNAKLFSKDCSPSFSQQGGRAAVQLFGSCQPGEVFTVGIFSISYYNEVKHLSVCSWLFGFSWVTLGRDIPGAPGGSQGLLLDLTAQSVVVSGQLLCLLRFVRVLGLVPAVPPWGYPCPHCPGFLGSFGKPAQGTLSLAPPSPCTGRLSRCHLTTYRCSRQSHVSLM